MFFELINSELAIALEKNGITEPTDIQKRVIPLIKEGRDVIACSETGTGKTFAYLLPLFEMTDRANKKPQALILTPTYELAAQVYKQCELINKHLPDERKIETALLIGGANLSRQLDELKKKPAILIGSPGRIMELNELKKLNMHFVKRIVLDEGDRLLDGNLNDTVAAVIKKTQKDRQLMLFSATVKQSDTERFAKLMKAPEIIDARNQTLPDSIEHQYISCGLREKMTVLRKLLHTPELSKSIVFINSSYHLKSVSEKLCFHKLACAPISGDKGKQARKKALEDFRDRRINILVASDLMARGIDIQNVSHIVNLDFPDSAEDYLHRAGRCGRQGKKGVCISILTQGEINKLMNYANRLGISVTEKHLEFGKIL